jgi:ABC-type oligopeptide transport system substrate-binding subunit
MTRLTMLGAALLAAASLTAAGCGGDDSSSDADQVTEIVVNGSKDPTYICDHLAKAVFAQFGTKAKCLEAAKTGGTVDPDPKTGTPKIDGDKASVTVTGKKGTETINLVKEDGEWKITAD